MLAPFAEFRAVAAAAGHEALAPIVGAITSFLTKEGSPLTASMLRDIERGGPTEGEHVLGDMAERAEQLGIRAPTLKLARSHVATYETRRKREQAAIVALVTWTPLSHAQFPAPIQQDGLLYFRS